MTTSQMNEGRNPPCRALTLSKWESNVRFIGSQSLVYGGAFNAETRLGFGKNQDRIVQ